MTWTLADLDGDTTLLTVNNRLAAELRRRYDGLQAAAGRRAWPSADVLPWSAWLRRCYERLLDTGFTDLDLLDSAQERLLWQEVIESREPPVGLLRPDAAAKGAQHAHGLLHDWELDRFPLAALGGDDTGRFLAWRRDFEDRLARRGLLSAGGLLGLVRSGLESGALDLPRRLVHSGFDALSPAQQGLFAQLAGRGCAIAEHRGEGRPGVRQRVEAADREAEIRLAAHWARRELIEDPRRRLAVVSPQIAPYRRDLERIFGEIVTPDAYLLQAGTQGLFNLSLGAPLADCPLVAHALLALDLVQGEQSLHHVGQLLRSPFVGGHAAEWEGRALCDAALRADGAPRIDLGRLRQRLAHFDAADPRHCPDLLARLDRFADLRRTLPASDSPHGWAGHLQRLLAVLGWPGDQALDSREFQQHERLRRLFSELAQLGKVRARLGLVEAVGQLRGLAAETVFQAESPDTPIQILGPLEAAGMDFDAIWLLGVHDQVWPPAPQPEPLLPSGLQRELGMPHACAERELAFATALTGRLIHSAARLTASHARVEDDREQRVSPLLRDWPPVDGADLLGGGAGDGLRAGCAVRTRLEPLPADHAGPPPRALRGGAGLLAAQAGCPFQAVARFRLAARPLEEPGFAADPALQGSLVHELLQRLWQTLGDSAALAALDQDGLRALVEPLAAATLADLGRRRPDLFTPRFRAIEGARLTRLMVDWLELERGRAQPFSVAALERDQAVELGDLRLTTRADRVDRLADGSLAVIDYKTGRSVRCEGWFDERLSEPQLPLYCLQGEDGAQADTRVGAVLLARVRRDETGCRFVGLGREDGFAPGVGTPRQHDAALDWPDLLAHWRRALDGLAGEIASGRADATPSPQACGYCPLGALCRVRERLLEDEGA